MTRTARMPRTLTRTTRMPRWLACCAHSFQRRAFLESRETFPADFGHDNSGAPNGSFRGISVRKA